MEIDVALRVASLIGVQRATNPSVSATDAATDCATGDRKHAPLLQSVCNDACNGCATEPDMACNGERETVAHSLHVIGVKVSRLTAKEVDEETSYNRTCCLLCHHLTRTGVCRSKSGQTSNYYPLEYGGRWQRCDFYQASS